MITCRLAYLELRCKERGYTLDEVAACIVKQDGDTVTVDETHPAYPSKPRRVSFGLGDIVAAGLSSVGITPERVSKALGVKDCGCRQRAEALNRLGRKFGIG
jgi:hypothetical protein